MKTLRNARVKETIAMLMIGDWFLASWLPSDTFVSGKSVHDDYERLSNV